MADLRKHSSVSNLMRFTLKHVTTGAGLTGLSSASSGLIISTIADNEAASTTYTVAGSTIETIATLGTFAAPTATKCRFKEVSATNNPGLYEFQFADARFAIANAERLVISVSGATDLLDADYEVQLDADVNVAGWSAALGTNDSYPATQLQVGSLGSISGGFSQPLSGVTITTGTETLTYTATEEEDGVLHEVAPVGGNTDFYYELDVGQLSTILSVAWRGKINSNGDSVTVQYYDWISSSYKTVRVLSGSNSAALIEDTFVLPISATGTGANIGLGRLRFLSTTSTNVATDRARVVFSERASGIANGSTVTLASSAANKNLIGNNWALELNGQNINDMYAQGGEVSGVGLVTAGHGHFNHFEVNDVTVGPTHFDSCGLKGTITMGSAGKFEIINCHTETAAGGNITIDGNSLAADTPLMMQGFKGSVTLVNLTAFHTITISGTELGNIILGGADADIKIRGIYESLVVNLTGLPTVTVEAIKASDIAAILADTADMQPRVVAVETDTGTTLPTDIANVKNDTEAILIDTGSTIPAILTIAQNDLDVITGVDGAVISAASELQLIIANWNRIISKANHNIGQSAAKILRQSGDLIQIDGAVSDASPTTTDFDTNLTQMDTYFADAIMIFVNGAANAGIGKPISTYVNASGHVTFEADLAWPETPVNGDDFVIVALHEHPISEIQEGLATEAKQDTAQSDLDIITGSDGVTLAAAQALYAPAKAGDNMGTVSSVTGNVVGSVASVTAIDTTGGAIDVVLVAGSVAGNVGGISGTINTLDALDMAQDAQHSATRAVVDDLAIKKNTAGLLHIEMVLASDHVTPATGLTVTAQRLIDSGAYVNVAGTMTEVSNGAYRFDYLAADSNGDVITWKFSSATADDTKILFKTVA